MSYMHNLRRGGKANKPRPVRVCMKFIDEPRSVHPDAPEYMVLGHPCGRAVSPEYNGNRCEDHRK